MALMTQRQIFLMCFTICDVVCMYMTSHAYRWICPSHVWWVWVRWTEVLSTRSYIYTYINIYTYNCNHNAQLGSECLARWLWLLSIRCLEEFASRSPAGRLMWFCCCIMIKCTERKRWQVTKLHFFGLKCEEHHLKVTLNQQHSSNMYFFHGRSCSPSIVKLGAKKATMLTLLCCSVLSIFHQS